MKRLISLLLSLMMLCAIPAAMAEDSPTFTSFGSDLFANMTYFDEHDYLFYFSYTQGSNMEERMLSNSDGVAVFLTHGGDTLIRIVYEPSGELWVIREVVFTSTVAKDNGGAMLDALTVMALALDIVDVRMDYATFRMIDTTDQFTTPFRQGRESFTVNGATVRHGMIDLGDAYQVTVVFSNLNKKVY